jgi:AcrR family transcriptional regulator
VDPASPEETLVSDTETEERGPKCRQVLSGARRVFMEHGFEGASVDEIARAAGTSKATLYSYFPDKRQLFSAVVQTECSRKQHMFGDIDPAEPVATGLPRIAAAFAGFLLSPGAQEMFRTCIAEAGRFPELGQAFHASGPAKAQARLVAYFVAANERGELEIDDPVMAADQFAALCKAGIFMRALLGLPVPNEAEIARTAEEAVRTFLARYGVAPAPQVV